MEIQIAEAIELIKTLAETENLTQSQALAAFVAEAGLDINSASALKAELFEAYTLREMASDSMTKALHSVFVDHTSASEDIQEVDTKETGEGTKYKVRVKDRQSGSSYVRYATREKVAELRANPNISSVEMTDYGSTGEDDKGERTAAAKGGGSDRDGDGNVESSSKEHAGVVHNAIQRKMGGKPDGQDTRKEGYERNIPQSSATARGGETAAIAKKAAAQRTAANASGARGPEFAGAAKMKQLKSTMPQTMRNSYEPEEDLVDEGIDFKGASRKQAAMDAEQKKKDEKSPSSKDRRLMMGKFRPGASKEEKAEGGRDSMREKGTSPKKNGKKMYEAYLELRAAKLAEKFEVTDADEKGNTEAYKRYKAGNPAYTKADAKKKVEAKEEWKPDPTEKRQKKAAKLGREEELERGKSKKYGRDENKIKDLYKRRIAVDFKKKKSSIGEDFVSEADLVDAGRENESQRTKKKLDGKDVDNSRNVVLMPSMSESVKTETPAPKSADRLLEAEQNLTVRSLIKGLVAEECCPKCGTPDCSCDPKVLKEKPKKKKATIDESGMPIFETEQESRNNARPGPSKEMIDPPADPQGDVGHMNPKGLPKRYKEKGEAPGDRRPNDPSGPDLPNEKGTVPNGSGV